MRRMGKVKIKKCTEKKRVAGCERRGVDAKLQQKERNQKKESEECEKRTTGAEGGRLVNGREEDEVRMRMRGWRVRPKNW